MSKSTEQRTPEAFQVEALLRTLFSQSELRRFLLLHYGRVVLDELPEGLSEDAYRHTAVTWLHRRGLLDVDFFRTLCRVLPGRADEVRAVAGPLFSGETRRASAVRYTDLVRSGYIRELAARFSDRVSALALLDSIGMPLARLPPMDSMSPEAFWQHVLGQLDAGILEDGMGRLVRQAAAQFPDNETLRRVVGDSTSKEATSYNVRLTVNLDSDISPEQMLKLLEAIRKVTAESGHEITLHSVRKG